MTCSTGCGSGWFAGDTGVHMNNMLGESDLALASLVLRPSDRITSMMSPTLVLGADGAVRLVVGAPGSARIRSAVTQVLTRALEGSMGLQDCVEAPRIHPEGELLDCEGGFREDVLDAVEASGEPVVRWPSTEPLLRRRAGRRGASGWTARGRRRPSSRRGRRGRSERVIGSAARVRAKR